MHTWMSLSLARNFFCNLAWGSAISSKPRSPTTTRGEGWAEEDEEAPLGPPRPVAQRVTHHPEWGQKDG